MSGNSKQRHKAKRTGLRIATQLQKFLSEAIRPMIKEECVEDFDKCIKELDEIIDDFKKPQLSTW